MTDRTKLIGEIEAKLSESMFFADRLEDVDILEVKKTLFMVKNTSIDSFIEKLEGMKEKGYNNINLSFSDDFIFSKKFTAEEKESNIIRGLKNMLDELNELKDKL